MDPQKIQDGQEKEAYLTMNIQLGEGKAESIELHEGDDLELIARDVAQRNGLIFIEYIFRAG